MSKSTPTILLAFEWFDDRIFKGIFRFVNERNWHISPYNFSRRSIPYRWPADGMISCYGRSLRAFILSQQIPKIDITPIEIPALIPRVIPNDEKIGKLAAVHLLERGFQNFAYFTWPYVPVNILRKKSFLKALLERGVEESRIFNIKQSPMPILHDWEKHQVNILDQLHHLPRPLAVFTGQDNLAANLIEVCVRNGIHVPEEIAILGVDNIRLLCKSIPVALSSVDTNLEKLGYYAAVQLEKLMLKKINCDEPPLNIDPKHVVTRQSTDIFAVPHPAVLKALQYIKKNFGKPITLEDICSHTKMSKRGMEKAFIKYLGRTPAVELRRFRLDYAKKLLTETTDKIDSIARACGYSNSSNLSCILNRETGMSPLAYRKRYQVQTKLNVRPNE